MVLNKYQHILTFDYLDYVHREFEAEEENSVGAVCHRLPLYITQHFLLHEIVEALSNRRFACLVTLLDFNLLDDFLELGLDFLLQKRLLLEDILHGLLPGIGLFLTWPHRVLRALRSSGSWTTLIIGGCLLERARSPSSPSRHLVIIVYVINFVYVKEFLEFWVE